MLLGVQVLGPSVFMKQVSFILTSLMYLGRKALLGSILMVTRRVKSRVGSRTSNAVSSQCLLLSNKFFHINKLSFPNTLLRPAFVAVLAPPDAASAEARWREVRQGEGR